jgi:uncharacterized membrane protein
MDPVQQGPEIARVVERNIQALISRRRAEDRQLRWQERLAARITAFTGSMTFVWLHVLVYGLWIAINLGGIPGIPKFDPTFVILAMEASVEAIFLSTFILITQNRMMAQADKRADLNLQISLLAEHEIRRLIKMVSEMGERMDLPSAKHPEVPELKQDVQPERVLDTLDKHQREFTESSPSDLARRPPRHQTGKSYTAVTSARPIPSAHTLPRLAIPAFVEKLSEPNPTTVVVPASSSARPTDLRTAARSPW